MSAKVSLLLKKQFLNDNNFLKPFILAHFQLLLPVYLFKLTLFECAKDSFYSYQ
jgi:hypothetical protein